MKKFPLAKASPFYPKQACDPEENPLLRGGLFPFRPTPPWKRPQVGVEGCQSLQCLRRCRDTLWWQEEYGQNWNQSWHRTDQKSCILGTQRSSPSCCYIISPLLTCLPVWHLCPARLPDSPCHKALPTALFFISGSTIWLQPAVCTAIGGLAVEMLHSWKMIFLHPARPG